MADNDLLALLEERLRGIYSPLLADLDATLVLTSGGLASCTVEFVHGRATARHGAPARPTTLVRGRADVLADIVRGRTSGVQAFLDQKIGVRGNVALAFELDGLFPSERADDPSRTSTHSVQAGGIETFYLEAGPLDAPPVVLVHGVTVTNASMLPLIPRLADRYRVIAPDLPGHGGTQATSAAHAARFLGDWLLDFVRKTCDRPAVLVGNSLGGRAALETALNAPDAVRALVLLCPAVAFRRLRQFAPVVRLLPDELASLPIRFPRTVALRGVRQLFADESRVPTSWLEASIDEFVRTMSDRAHRLAAFSAIRHIYLDKPFGEGGFWDRLPTLEPPALFLWGDKDMLVPPGFSRFVEQALPSAASIVLRDCGHVPQLEFPDLTATYVHEFVDSLDDAFRTG